MRSKAIKKKASVYLRIFSKLNFVISHKDSYLKCISSEREFLNAQVLNIESFQKRGVESFNYRIHKWKRSVDKTDADTGRKV